jgi:3-hydroxyisobutyrate dehydrogenase
VDAISFFGLGTMGFVIAGRLAAAGHPIAVHDVSADRCADWSQRFTAAAHDLAAARFIITCVTDDAALRALLTGERGLIARVRPGACFIDHTTAAPETARELAGAAAARGAVALDAPLSGGRAGAEAGTLSAMIGGDLEALDRARPILSVYAASVVHCGAAGAGQVAKLANQVAIAGIVRGLAEAVTLARAGGLDPATVLAALARGTARSMQLERLSGTLADDAWRFEHTFAWLAKDLRLALDEAVADGASLPMTELIGALLREVA